jgi:FlaA1/EpsC-like NDP-sugar epimerase
MVICILLRYTVFTGPTPLFAYISAWQIVLIFIFTTLISGGIRVLVKIVYDIVTSDRKAIRVLVYGTQEGGIGIAKNIRAQRPTRFMLRGFIAHMEGYSHHLLMGEKVYETPEEVAHAVERLKIEAVLVSPLRSEEFRNDQKLQDVLIGAGVKIYMVGTPQEWDGKSLPSGQMLLTEVQVEDLLPRDKIVVDMQSIGRRLQDKRVLITGAAGSIGSEMVRQLASFNPVGMVLIDEAETPLHDIRLMMDHDWPGVKAETIVTNICNQERMDKVFNEFRPNYVFHAAAYKHVPMMEDNPSEAIQNNVLGTKVLADVSVKYGVEKFVMVSTDKAVNPTNVMGCSKRICEIYVQALNDYIHKQHNDANAVVTQFVTTRFGNVLGSNGSVIPLFREQIKNGGPVTVTHPDIIRFFMLIPEACQLVLEAGVKGNGGEIFVFDMGKPVRIADLAQRMIRLSGATNVEIKFTGLRAGEKLYEEVLSDKENTKPSFHEKIRIANVRQYDFNEVCRAIDDLISISRSFDNMNIVKKMKQIVPEYKSQNSVYSELDK